MPKDFDSAKTKSSLKTLPLVGSFRDYFQKVKEAQELNKKVCGNCYNYEYDGYVFVNEPGGRMRAAFEEGKLDYDTVTEIMAEVKPNQVEKLKIPMDDIRKYVPKDFTPQQISELAISLFKQYYNRQHNLDAR